MDDAGPTTTANPHTALAILRDDHRRLERLLRMYALLPPTSQADREGLIARIGACLRALIEVKEHLLYPLLAPMAEREQLARARRDHQLLDERLRAVAGKDHDTVAMDLQLSELAELARAHIAMEESQLFPLAESLDSVELGDRVALCRSAVLGEQGPD